ncbi:hypothetical protein Tco_0546389 [Tanacetum coccineum]
MVRVQEPRCMAWLDYDEHVDILSTMDNEVGVTSPKSTTQTLLSFEEYTPPMTYPKEAEKTLGTPIEVEPLNETKLKEVGLNCNNNIPLSSREIPSFDEPKPQPNPLPNFPSLDVSLGEERGPEPPIKPHSPDSFRMKPKEVKKVRIKETRHLKHIIQQPISQRMAPSHHEVLAQMAHLVANITFASTRSVVMEIASLAQREISWHIYRFLMEIYGKGSTRFLLRFCCWTIVVAIVGCYDCCCCCGELLL